MKTEMFIKLPNGTELTEKEAREVYAKLDELFGYSSPPTVAPYEVIGPGVFPGIDPYKITCDISGAK